MTTFRTPVFYRYDRPQFPIVENSNVSYYFDVIPPPSPEDIQTLRAPVFTRFTPRYVDLSPQFINTALYNAPNAVNFNTVRTPVFTRIQPRLVDVSAPYINLLSSTLSPPSSPPVVSKFDYPNPTLRTVLREYGFIGSSYLIGGIPVPPLPPIPTSAGRIVLSSELTEIDGRNWRKGMEQVLIREAAKALGRQGGIASGKTRRRG